MVWAHFWFFSPIPLVILTTTFNLQCMRLEEKSHHKSTWSLWILYCTQSSGFPLLFMGKREEEKNPKPMADSKLG